LFSHLYFAVELIFPSGFLKTRTGRENRTVGNPAKLQSGRLMEVGMKMEIKQLLLLVNRGAQLHFPYSEWLYGLWRNDQHPPTRNERLASSAETG